MVPFDVSNFVDHMREMRQQAKTFLVNSERNERLMCMWVALTE